MRILQCILHLNIINTFGLFWRNTLYEYKCLPFRLSSAPWVFTKLFKPVMGHSRKFGFRIAIYLDYILLMTRSPEVLHHLCILVYLLVSLENIINWDKSVFTPFQPLEYLGLVIDTASMSCWLSMGPKLSRPFPCASRLSTKMKLSWETSLLFLESLSGPLLRTRSLRDIPIPCVVI